MIRIVPCTANHVSDAPEIVEERVCKMQTERETPMLPIPLRIVMPHAEQALINHQMSLGAFERVGGMTPRQMLHVLLDVPWGYGEDSRRIRDYLTQQEADQEVRAYVRIVYPMMIAFERAALQLPPCTHDVPPPDAAKDATGVHKCPRCGVLMFDYAYGPTPI